ncbi:histone deacetylation protein Rxt3 [Ophiocordyceps sinensis CO18]|uniref:Histone deacetylation protein Rxt3 n=1 Tax=Ophiocordyceps sinensis (strain Co18 / CGMCC 3.14243) TaxID=911162 RepID=T4ZWG0_OPHSC|nr:histone deacetylation protein Rxt3 [Ophiocordyceps sinensis CO18]
MFSGIGSGVSAIGVSSPATSGAVAAYGSAPSIKREDVENAAPDSGPEAVGKGKSRRRKLKDDETRGDDDTPGRVTPGGRANKRAKAHQHHHHQYVPTSRSLNTLSDKVLRESSHHHHHHHHASEATSSPTAGVAPFKNLKGAPSAASPTEKGAPASHHHHHHHHGSRAVQQAHGSQAKQPAQSPTPVIPPKPKMTITSKAVLDAVSHRPRHHLGDFIYEAGLKPGRLLLNTPSHRGFSSNPKPLPWDVIEGKENCILTVKVPRVHLSPPAREEITARAYLWGTDVYTDDSDVMAACIHGGWVKGEWAEDFDSATFDLDDGGPRRKPKNRANESLDLESEGLITSPPQSGPLSIPNNRDLHVNVLILPKLAKYAATTRFGIASREFGGQYGARQSVHDSISYMVESIRWVENGGQPQARLRGKARRERMRKVMREVTASFGNTNGLEQQQLQPGNDHDAGVLRSAIIGSWHRRGAEEPPKESAERGDKDREPSEGDKENRAAHENLPAEAPQDAKVAPNENMEVVDSEKSTSGDNK